MKYTALSYIQQISLNQNDFCIASTIDIYLLILVIPIIITIIYLSNPMDISYILDSEQDYQRRQRDRKQFMNLLLKKINNRAFVYDMFDPTGTNLNNLFAGKQYPSYLHLGYCGYIFTDSKFKIRTSLDGNAHVRLPAFADKIDIQRSRGFVILSGSTLIEIQGTFQLSRTLIVKGSE